RPYVGHPAEGMKIWSDLRSDAQGANGATQHMLSTYSSEIPCRVSSDPHERCNDLAAVSRRDPAKLRYPCRRGLRTLGQKDPVELYCILALDWGYACVA